MNSPQRHRDTETNDLNSLTQAIIGAAIAVHRVLGPGLLESIYETALCVELDDLGIKYVRQYRVPAYYKGRMLGNHFVDLIVDNRVIVEVKSVAAVHPVMEAQLISYMRLTNKKVGLLINFNSPVVTDGVMRRVL